MRIGVLSDSHGRVRPTRAAVDALLERGADMLLHLGDLGTVQVIDELVGRNARVVLGNCDWPPEPLLRHARAMDIPVDHPMGRLDVDGRSIAYMHGHVESALDEAIATTDYVLHGHTHEMRDEHVGRCRVINPGALFRARRYTAVLLDPAADSVEFIEIPRLP